MKAEMQVAASSHDGIKNHDTPMSIRNITWGLAVNHSQN